MNFEPIRSSRRRKEKEKKKILHYFPYVGPKEGRERAVQEVMMFFFVSSGNREELKNTKKKVVWGLWEEIDGDLCHVCYL